MVLSMPKVFTVLMLPKSVTLSQIFFSELQTFVTIRHPSECLNKCLKISMPKADCII